MIRLPSTIQHLRHEDSDNFVNVECNRFCLREAVLQPAFYSEAGQDRVRPGSGEVRGAVAELPEVQGNAL